MWRSVQVPALGGAMHASHTLAIRRIDVGASLERGVNPACRLDSVRQARARGNTRLPKLAKKPRPGNAGHVHGNGEVSMVPNALHMLRERVTGVAACIQADGPMTNACFVLFCYFHFCVVSAARARLPCAGRT